MAEYYNKPDPLAKLINSTLRQFASIGLAPRDTVALQVCGRKSGKKRSNVVTYVEHDGARYLVAPRGTTEWVRNVRAAGGEASLKHGRSKAVRLVEVPEAERAAIIRLYLKKMPRWSSGSSAWRRTLRRINASRLGIRCSVSRTARRPSDVPPRPLLRANRLVDPEPPRCTARSALTGLPRRKADARERVLAVRWLDHGGRLALSLPELWRFSVRLENGAVACAPARPRCG